MRLTHSRTAIAVWLLLATAISDANAYGTLMLIEAPPKENYRLSVGPSLLTFPSYPGASSRRTWLIPGINYYDAAAVFLSTDYGLGWNLSSLPELQAGVRLWPQFGRPADAEGRSGLRGVRSRIGEGVFVNYAPLEFLVLQSSALYGLGRDRNGLLIELGVTAGVPLAGGSLALSLGTSWANQRYRRSYFGVGADEASATGLQAWSPNAGRQDVSLALSLDLPIAPSWSISGQLLQARLLGDAASSPVTRDRRQSLLSATLWYTFR